MGSLALAGLAKSASQAIFGEALTIVQGATTLTCRGIFDAATVGKDNESGGVIDVAPRALVSDAALGTLTVVTDETEVTARGVTYVVREIMPDGMGGRLLILREADT